MPRSPLNATKDEKRPAGFGFQLKIINKVYFCCLEKVNVGNVGFSFPIKCPKGLERNVGISFFSYFIKHIFRVDEICFWPKRHLLSNIKEFYEEKSF